MPDEILRNISKGLEAEQLEPKSFAPLLNLALLLDIPASQAELAASALRRVKYSIETATEETSIFDLVSGLAVVAAVTRGTDLADTVRVLTRVMRRRNRFPANPDEELRVAMIAGASHEDIENWARFIGEWITEIAFEAAKSEATQQMLAKLRRLIQISPVLARHSAAAQAALASCSR